MDFFGIFRSVIFSDPKSGEKESDPRLLQDCYKYNLIRFKVKNRTRSFIRLSKIINKLLIRLIKFIKQSINYCFYVIYLQSLLRFS